MIDMFPNSKYQRYKLGLWENRRLAPDVKKKKKMLKLLLI